MRLGERSAFFIPGNMHSLDSQNFCRSPVMKDLCFCPQIFKEELRKKRQCLCGKNIFFQVGLFIIFDQEGNKHLALKLKNAFFNILSANYNKYSVGMKHELQLSCKYVSNQLLVAE